MPKVSVFNKCLYPLSFSRLAGGMERTKDREKIGRKQHKSQASEAIEKIV